MNQELKLAIEFITGKVYTDNKPAKFSSLSSEEQMAEDLMERTKFWEKLELEYHELVNLYKKKNK